MVHAFAPARSRGRPKKASAPSARGETGTAELLFKRAYHETTEAIDLCLERRLINDAQHWSGLHLRWLHTIRFGAPGISALDLTQLNGQEPGEQDDPEWRVAREAEYNEALGLLKSARRLTPVLTVCVYNERPIYLQRHWLQLAWDSHALAAQIERSILELREGLELLAKHWGRKAH